MKIIFIYIFQPFARAFPSCFFSAFCYAPRQVQEEKKNSIKFQKFGGEFFQLKNTNIQHL
jgi:hypothetical protein